MRVWDIPVELLCWTHLNAQHREIHCIYGSILNFHKGGKYGYSNHPEVQRWIGHEKILIQTHEITANEMSRRSKNHKSPIKSVEFEQCNESLLLVDSIEDQIKNLQCKSEDSSHKCKCNIDLINDWYYKCKLIRNMLCLEI